MSVPPGYKAQYRDVAQARLELESVERLVLHAQEVLRDAERGIPTLLNEPVTVVIGSQAVTVTCVDTYNRRFEYTTSEVIA